MSLQGLFQLSCFPVVERSEGVITGRSVSCADTTYIRKKYKNISLLLSGELSVLRLVGYGWIREKEERKRLRNKSWNGEIRFIGGNKKQFSVQHFPLWLAKPLLHKSTSLPLPPSLSHSRTLKFFLRRYFCDNVRVS